MTSRYDRLMSMYWAAVYMEMEEQTNKEQSQAVLEICRACKEIVRSEIKRCGYSAFSEHSEPKE